MADDLQPDLSRLLLDAFRKISGEIDHALEDRGAGDLTPSQASAIIHVERTGIRLTDLAERAQVSKQAMMQVLDELESKGYVRRSPDPSDARAKIVRPTSKGLKQRAEARRAVTGVEARIRRRIGERRHQGLREALVSLGEPED